MADQRLDDRTERPLDGTDVGSGGVARLLVAARAAAHPDEVRREDVTLGAFRVARGTTPAPRRHVRALRRTPWSASVMGVKLVVAGTTVFAADVALATGAVGLTMASAPVPVPTGSAVAPVPIDPPMPVYRSVSVPPAGPTTGTSRPGVSPSLGPCAAAIDQASVVGLGDAYRTRGDCDPEAAMGGAAFLALTAAGGRDLVESFCTAALGVAPGPSTSPRGLPR